MPFSRHRYKAGENWRFLPLLLFFCQAAGVALPVEAVVPPVASPIPVVSAMPVPSTGLVPSVTPEVVVPWLAGTFLAGAG